MTGAATMKALMSFKQTDLTMFYGVMVMDSMWDWSILSNAILSKRLTPEVTSLVNIPDF